MARRGGRDEKAVSGKTGGGERADAGGRRGGGRTKNRARACATSGAKKSRACAKRYLFWHMAACAIAASHLRINNRISLKCRRRKRFSATSGAIVAA